MYEACAPNREDICREASATLQKLFTSGSLGSRIRDARRVLCAKPYDWSRNRVFDVFNGKAAVVHGHEIDHVRHLKRLNDIEEAKNEQQEIDALRSRLARLETMLFAGDATFHRPQIEALRGSLRGLGGVVDRAGTDGAGE